MNALILWNCQRKMASAKSLAPPNRILFQQARNAQAFPGVNGKGQNAAISRLTYLNRALQTIVNMKTTGGGSGNMGIPFPHYGHKKESNRCIGCGDLDRRDRRLRVSLVALVQS